MPTILYAEDDPENRRMMRIILNNQDLTLLEAVDGRTALKMVDIHWPDLIILDLFMPNLDGFGVMKVLKADAQTAQIPIIILSAWPTGDNRKRAEQAGAVDFVAKPFDPSQIIEAIDKYLVIRN